MSALARKIAQYLAKGQVKKAARLEADQAIRREIWDKYEQVTINKLRAVGKPPLPVKEGIAELEPILVGSTDRAIAAATQKLISRGYTVEQANNLADRLYVKANSEIGASLYNIHGVQPPPKIVPSRKPRVTMTTLRSKWGVGEKTNRTLNALYNHLPENTIVEFDGRLYRKQGLSTVPQHLMGDVNLNPTERELSLGSYWIEVEPSAIPPLTSGRE